MHQDFLDLLRAFVDRDVRFLIVGAYALAVHGRPRATGDLGVWVDATPVNAPKIMAALEQFGAPTAQVRTEDVTRPGIVFQMGLPSVAKRSSRRSVPRAAHETSGTLRRSASQPDLTSGAPRVRLDEVEHQ